MSISLVYFIIINIVTFIAFTIDKLKAKTNAWRIPEAQLLGLCLIGGALGGYAAMQLVRHKTKHLKFMIGVPVMLVMQLVVGYYWFN